MENSLSRYQELLGILNRSKAKQRRGSDGGRSASTGEAKYKQKQATYTENQNLYRGDFESKPGMYQQVVVPYYNPTTGAEWSAPNPGYTPKPGTGWVKGFKPKETTPTPPKSSTRIDESDPRYQSILEYFKKNPPKTYLDPIEYKKPSYKQIPEKTPTASTNPNLTKNVLDRMASF